MNFSFSEEQHEVQQLARKIFGDLAGEAQQKAIDVGGERFDAKLWQQMADSGLLGITIDEEYGGMGFGYETLGLLLEEAGRSVVPVPVVSCLVSAALPLQRFGAEAQKQRWLPGLVSGETILTAALVEPLNDNSGKPRTTAALSENGCVLQGCKHAVPCANRAERVLLAARSPAGTVLALVDPRADGVSLTAQATTANEPTFEMRLESVTVDAEDILLTGDAADACLRWTAERTIAANCIMAAGVTDAMLRMTASYTSERQQFGRAIATFQAVGQRAADCFIDIDCLRLVSQEALSLLDKEKDATDAVLVAKIWCGDVTHRISQASQHLHGGIGVDRDYPLFRYCLWCKQLELALGSSASSTETLGERIAAEFLAA